MIKPTKKVPPLINGKDTSTETNCEKKGYITIPVQELIVKTNHHTSTETNCEKKGYITIPVQKLIVKRKATSPYQYRN